MTPDDIDISVSEGVLTISGERTDEPDDADVTPYVRERYHGHFRRSMVLPDGVDERRISATFDNGVVRTTVPDAVDAEVPTPHRVHIAKWLDTETLRELDAQVLVDQRSAEDVAEDWLAEQGFDRLGHAPASPLVPHASHVRQSGPARDGGRYDELIRSPRWPRGPRWVTTRAGSRAS